MKTTQGAVATARASKQSCLCHDERGREQRWSIVNTHQNKKKPKIVNREKVCGTRAGNGVKLKLLESVGEDESKHGS